MNLNLNKYSAVKLLCLVILPGFIYGCEQIMEMPVDSKGYEKIPVVEGFLTNKFEKQVVRVSYTLPLSDSLSCKVIPDATVLIYSNTGDTAHFNYLEDGWYESAPYAAEEGKQYTLEVKIDTFVAKCVSDYIPEKKIDSLFYRRYRQANSKDTVYHVYMNAGSVDPTYTRYYMLEVYRNHNQITLGDEVWTFKDDLSVNLRNIEIPVESRKGDTIDIELHTLTEPMYNYYSRYTEVIVSDDIVNQNYRENPPIMFNKKVIGYFKVSAVYSKRIIIE
jgi:hypothetical protein